MVVYSDYVTDTRVMQYATALVDRGDTVDVIGIGQPGTSSFEIWQGVNVFRIQRRIKNEKGALDYAIRILRFFFAAGWMLTKRHLSRPYDVIHVHSVPDFLVFTALVPRATGARVILDIHDILPEFYASKFGAGQDSLMFRFLLMAERLSIGFSHHLIIANHLWHKRLVSRSVAPARCTAIINYPDAELFRTRPRSRSNGTFIVMYPGTLNAHQGLDVAIRAFAEASREAPDMEFHIYGDGPARTSLIRLSEELKLTDRIRFFGFLPTAEIATIMAEADLAVVPKRASSPFGNEAASTKIMEFMSLGVPVIVSRTAIDAYYHDESRVKFFESENEAALTAAILELRNNEELRRSLLANAALYIRDNNWSTRRQDYLNIVDRLAAAVPLEAGMVKSHSARSH
jgi:glycosyltransferase involved in cell wall biosynthesis